MNFKKIKTYYKPWAFAVVNNFLSRQEILNVKREILKIGNFDDKVMVNRKRVNKGSTNFEHLTKKSKAIKKLYKKINSVNFYRKISQIFENEKLEWIPNDEFSVYSENFYGEQKFSLKEKIIKKLSFLNLIKTSMNLDIDFSVSEKGYYRAPHRDRDTRVINFLIYLNTMDSNCGGSLEIHKSKINKNKQEDYNRFPKMNEVRCVKKIQPKAGTMVVFSSSPNSYHAAEKIKKNNLKRVFIYGSFSLNKKVLWTKNNLK
tara:strand:- start:3234 stop:4010 length:777 start_codon:yes stop_codon:yes gene_type:complete